MKKVIALALAGSLALSGCAQLSQAVDSAFGAGTAAKIVSDLQNFTVAACGFLPTAATAAAVVQQYPELAGVATGLQTIAGYICAVAVPAKASMKRGAGVPTLRGVPIRGRFLQ